MKLPLMISILAVSALFQSNTCLAHGGGTDSNGCHTNKKTGDRHCHEKKSSSSSSSNISSDSTYQSNLYSSGGYRAKSSGIKVEYVDKINKISKGVSKPCPVVGISDGDTFTCILNGIETKIRLHGIDAPEDGQAFGNKSKGTLKQLISGRSVSVDIVDTDKYGRSVALVFADGMNVNETMVRSGAAWVYPMYCNNSYCSEWNEYQQNAKSSRKLLWQDANPVPPWEWRHRK